MSWPILLHANKGEAMRSGNRRILDFGSYIIISLAVVASMFVATAWNISPADYLRWVGLIGITLVVFGLIIGDNKTLWSKKAFWIALSTIFIVHCVVFAGLEIKRVNFSGVKVMLIIIVEIGFIHVLKKRLVRM